MCEKGGSRSTIAAPPAAAEEDPITQDVVPGTQQYGWARWEVLNAMGLKSVSSEDVDVFVHDCLVYNYKSIADRQLIIRETPVAADPTRGIAQSDPSKQKEEFDGTGAVLWPCALILAEYFLSSECGFTSSSDKSFFMVELGCGVGAASLAFALANSKHCIKQVCLTDMATTAVHRNLAVFQHKNPALCSQVPVAASSLPWGDRAAVQSLLERHREQAQAADQILICASDVLYNQTPHVIGLLVATIKQLLTEFAQLKSVGADKHLGRCFISFEMRNDWFLFHEFAEQAEAAGFAWNNEDVSAFSRQDGTDYYCCELWLLEAA